MLSVRQKLKVEVSVQKLGVGVLLLVWAQIAMADQVGCSSQLVFTCSTTYVLNRGETVAGPTDSRPYANIQPEPFDPAECQASVVLYTYVGKFVATSGQVFGSPAFLDANGKETLLKSDAGAALTYTVDSPFQGDVQKAIFKCRVFNQD